MDDIVTYGDQRFRLADLAGAMEDEHREAIHSTPGTDTPEAFWAAFCRRYPDEAQHLAEITPAAPAVPDEPTLAELSRYAGDPE